MTMSRNDINQIDLFTTEPTHRLVFIDKITGEIKKEYNGKECVGTFKQMIWQQKFYNVDAPDIYTMIKSI